MFPVYPPSPLPLVLYMKVVLVVLVVKATICVTGAVCQDRGRQAGAVKSVQDTTVGLGTSHTRDVVEVVTLSPDLVTGY